MQDEILDIVDQYDQVIGTVLRDSAASDTCGNIRIVLAFLVDQNGRIGLLKRTANKDTDPLSWALVGGCVSSGEDYDTAIAREVAEEVNLNPSDYQISLLGYYPPQMGWTGRQGLGFYKKIYQIKVNTTNIAYNPDDFCQIMWASPAEFIKMQETLQFAKGTIWLIGQSYL
ncbi:hypothetical protein BH09DEP1_BH09DEP1_4880 [soil metagenome]